MRMAIDSKYKPWMGEQDLNFKIKICSIFSGNIGTEITISGVSFDYVFDAAFDYIRDLMKIYIAVRDYDKNFQNSIWEDGRILRKWWGDDILIFELLHLEDDYFLLHINVNFFTCKSEEPEVFNQSVILKKDEFLCVLDLFFDEIRKDKGFPMKYPIGDMCLLDTIDTNEDVLAYEIFSVLPEYISKDREIRQVINEVCKNVLAKLSPGREKYVDDYREMLEKHIIPESFK